MDPGGPAEFGFNVFLCRLVCFSTGDAACLSGMRLEAEKSRSSSGVFMAVSLFLAGEALQPFRPAPVAQERPVRTLRVCWCFRGGMENRLADFYSTTCRSSQAS